MQNENKAKYILWLSATPLQAPVKNDESLYNMMKACSKHDQNSIWRIWYAKRSVE